MLKTRTDLWMLALMGTLGASLTHCGSSTTDGGRASGELGSSDDPKEMQPTTDPEEGMNSGASPGGSDSEDRDTLDDDANDGDANGGEDLPSVAPSDGPGMVPPGDLDPSGGDADDDDGAANDDDSDDGDADDGDSETDPPIDADPSSDDGPTPTDAPDPDEIIVPDVPVDVDPVTDDPTTPTTPDPDEPTTVEPPGDGGTPMTPGVASGCDDGMPLLAGEVNTGLVQCKSGVIHRPEPVECPNRLDTRSGPSAIENPENACSSDAECTAQAYGFCDLPPSAGQALPVLACLYGCVTDADCGADQICVCGETIGACVASACSGASDCGDGLLCAQYYDRFGIGCSEPALYACQTPEDECVSDEDCPQGDNGGNCTAASGTRMCQEIPGLACGRPFLVDGQARLPELAASADWCASLESTPAAATLSPQLRERLGQSWAEIGRMEHASIAAFARFVLQLMQLGAPRELVEAAQQAMLDETRHAKLCFGLATSYLGRATGAGALEMERALAATELAQIVRLVFLEGCVGETIAALEAAECAAHCEEPAVKAVLASIREDERRHAELAWKFVAWALAAEPSLAPLIEAECRSLEAETKLPRAAVGDDGADLLVHGVASAALRVEVRAAALSDVVLPCARALLAQGYRAPLTAAQRDVV